ncbi:DUF3489 domain-containing protein [Psychromarinibacter halotolerans]|uniref:DUF3489 domain-containing protein n=1 Tax=Psychromarinibacter halotolerans TaxID=1775175 RepID=A0ABV7GS58_9RHOB|nr:DUF3489 domain-containing protein [Psychromarinibacter halotolerans]MDF0596898.1 DUF3489 domain-containing protein [Psychromarinibacter halotolerans]
MTETIQATKPKSRGTKKAQLIRLLKAKAGADIASISKRLGWQPHTTRAALSGLRKAGYVLSMDRSEGKPPRYRITAEPEAANG